MSAVGIGPWSPDSAAGIAVVPGVEQDRDCVVRDIRSAPSLRSARAALRQEELDRRLARHRHPSARGARVIEGTVAAPKAKAATVSAPNLVLRSIVFIVSFVIVVSAATVLGLSLQPAGYAGETWSHAVSSGESLWALAEGIESARPIEQVMEDIRDLNGLKTDHIYAGQMIELPTE